MIFPLRKQQPFDVPGIKSLYIRNSNIIAMDIFASKVEWIILVVIAGVVTAVVAGYLEHTWYDTSALEELCLE